MLDFIICMLIMLSAICSYINAYVRQDKLNVYACIFFDVLAFIVILLQLI